MRKFRFYRITACCGRSALVSEKNRIYIVKLCKPEEVCKVDETFRQNRAAQLGDKYLEKRLKGLLEKAEF